MRLWSVGHVAMRFAVAADSAALSYRLDRAKLRQARRREGRYLLRTNLTDDDPARLWRLYLQLVSVEEAFRNLKGLPHEGRGRPRHPADLSPGRGAHRGAYLHRLPRLLPPRHARSGVFTPWRPASPRAVPSKNSPLCR